MLTTALVRGARSCLRAAGLAFVLLAVQAHAQVIDGAIGIAFPGRLGGLAFAGQSTFPQRELGVSYAYEDRAMRATVYVYAGGYRSIPDGIASEVATLQLEQAVGDALGMERLGRVRSATLLESSAGTRVADGCGPPMLRRDLDIVLLDGTALASHVFLTAMKDNFVKVRLSYRTDRPQGNRDAEGFVAELRKLLGRCAPG